MSRTPTPPPPEVETVVTEFYSGQQITKEKKKVRVKRKPARKQVEVGQIEKKQPQQTGQTYNIWYHKWAGGDRFDAYNIKEKSQTRCSIADDAGYTRADGGNNAYCCLFFARGCCPYGHECSYLHRLPNPKTSLPDASLDVFGREKHSDYRDDMGGVGSFSRQNRTLYIGRIKEKRGNVEESEKMVERHFSEWGEIERIRILQNRGVAFVTYVSELSAQFAKEAMMCQSLDEDEVINVRWATEDPNPVAKVREHDRLKQLGEEGIAKNLPANLVKAVRELDELDGLVEEREEDLSDVRSTKRRRIEGAEELSASTLPSLPQATSSVNTTASAPLPSTGLLASVNASMGFYNSLKQTEGATSVFKAGNKTGGGGLVSYGSDDEDD